MTIEPIDKLDLRALASAISSQPLSLRQRIHQAAVFSDPAKTVFLCRELLSESKWNQFEKSALKKLAGWSEGGMECISIFEAGYPEALRMIEDPPLLLFFRERSIADLKETCCIAVVGSRRADPDGLEMAEQFSRQLSSLGVVIISGLALGIDGAAHRGAIQTDSELPTVGVLGSGLDLVYPSQHLSLSEEILDRGGILISQFEPGTPPYPANFLNRNRVVSGLAQAVLVVEATLKSGSLVTARNALEQGKEVLVIPGDVNNPRFEGSNRLIQQGATLVTSVQDIVEAIGIVPQQTSKTFSSELDKSGASVLASELEVRIIESLGRKHELRVDELLRDLGPVSLERELFTLEMRGTIQRLPGNVIRLKRQHHS